MNELAVIEFAVSTTPSGNTLWGRFGHHMANRARYKKIRDGYQLQVLDASGLGWRTWPHNLKRAVLFTRHNPTRQELDLDRLIQGCTPVQDALTRVGLIVDDAPSYAEIEWAQQPAGSRRLARTVVRVALLETPARWTPKTVANWCARIGISVPEEVA